MTRACLFASELSEADQRLRRSLVGTLGMTNDIATASMVESRDPSRAPRIALTLGGGGARSAYQVGVLRAIARLYPNLRIPLLTGVSSGAINIAHLANHTGSFSEQVDALTELWRILRLNNVFSTGGLGLVWRALRIGIRLSLGLPPGMRSVHGMVDTQPLRQFLHRALRTTDGSLPGILQNIDQGRLDAVALTALSYGTGHTVTFVQGQDISTWERPLRRSTRSRLTVEHIMASAALPLFFPPVQIEDDWYGDGGVRLIAPLGPALHLGADRILAISNHYTGASNNLRPVNEVPAPATVMGALYNAVFLDHLDQDVWQMQQINELVRELPPEKCHDMHDVKLLVIRPSEDLGALAYQLRDQLPPTFRYLMDRLGTGQVRSQDFLSTVLFQSTFIERLIEIGEHDGQAMGSELQEFLEA